MDSDIRPAGAGDLAAIAALVDGAYGHYVARIGRKPGPMLADHAARIATGQTHLLEGGGAVLGLIVLVAQADALLVENLAVAPGAQGRGLGRRLMDFAEKRARALGLPRLRLYTHVAMVENQALYARLGYVETHRIREEGLDRVYMEKPLP
ncbi:GNAT family N-acetyltransferase [Paracoccus binzhouensis]|uniref:GNAT family N-acetyltransferase n=1 Tax=Paracoccus binzhouensis TaxID=2796149 RepID=UPI0018EEE118|nr:GNAT family N-acetyltransferase [Paracoccus binzhouensis]